MMEALLRRENLSEDFPQEVMREARETPQEVHQDEINSRVDLRNLSIITIDGADAKDLDDAVYVEKKENGNYRLIVSIADVSYYVKEGSAMDKEALRRGNSVYLVDRVLPMLPRELSNGICSLNPNEDKLTFTCEMEIDKEALRRGNSVYLVDRVLPMLPRELSNGICSLNPNEDKLTFTCEMEIDSLGKVKDVKTYKAVIRTAYRMTYTDVNKILENDDEICKKYAPIKNMVDMMLELSKIIRNVKHSRGSIDFDLPEIKVVLDEKLKVDHLEKRERGEAEKIIEDFMIEANEAVAEKLFWLEVPSIYRTHEKLKVDHLEKRERGEAEKIIEDFMIEANEAVAEKLFWLEVPSIYRTHEKPDAERIQELNDVLGKFGYKVMFGSEGVHPKKFQSIIEDPSIYRTHEKPDAERIQELNDVLGKFGYKVMFGSEGVHPKKFQSIIEDSQIKGISMIVHKMILMALKQARYTPENIGHFGLASSYYTHFTSPIRRYSDLMIHRILGETLVGYPKKKYLEKLEKNLPTICTAISKTERDAMKVEEESKKIKIVEYMLDKIGEVFKGTIVGISNRKVFVETEELVECMWDVTNSPHYYEFDEKNYAMIDTDSGEIFNLGDKLDVIVVRADMSDLEVEVAPYNEEYFSERRNRRGER